MSALDQFKASDRRAIKAFTRAFLAERGAPPGATAEGVLAAAMWDADNTNRLQEMPQEVNDAMIAKAVRVLAWARAQGWELRFSGR